MSIPIEQIPEAAAGAARRVAEQVQVILGEDLVAVWLHGGTTFADRPRVVGDIDLCVVISRLTPAEQDPASWREDPRSRPSRLDAAVAAIAKDSNVTFDITWWLIEESRGDRSMSNAFDRARSRPQWPIERGHLLAGQYVHIYGRRPEELLSAPTRTEIETALDRELEHLERHVLEGDAANPYEATYAVWNGCRILYTLETGALAISKRSAGMWALEHLPKRWHAAIRAAERAYDGEADAVDNELLRLTMPDFVAMVRERLRITEPRPPGPPRWS